MRNLSGRHYEAAFESWLVEHRVTYVKADEHERPGSAGKSVKNFDFLVYPGRDRKIIVEVKGRTFTGTALAGRSGLECWVTRDDIEGLHLWREALGPDHEVVFVFAYRVARVDVDFDGCDVLTCGPDRYLFFCVPLDDYCRHMKRRSPKWHTMTLPAARFRQCAVSLAAFLL
jgi:hypothetical protein